MNFLAHCALATDAAKQWHCNQKEQEGLVAGAVIGDFAKGLVNPAWPRPLQAGVHLHRKIDALSNQHPAVKTGSNRFPTNLRRLAPIFLDLLADYHLANRWHKYYEPDLAEFSRVCYASIRVYQHYLPQRGQKFVNYMERVDLLHHYKNWDAVVVGLESVLRRLQQPPGKAEVISACRRLTPEVETDFVQLYPDLRAHWQTWNAFDVIAAPQS